MTSYSRKPRSRNSSARSRGKDRRISVRGVRRAEPDVRKLARALIALALAQAEADAQAEAETGRAAAQRQSGNPGHPDYDASPSGTDTEVPDAR